MTENATTREDAMQPIVRVRTSDMDLPADECRIPTRSDPCTIVIAGATGDLTARKLMPALFNLYCNEGLPESFAIVGCGRTELSDQRFRTKMSAALADEGDDRSRHQHFIKSLYYMPITYD
ncbi:MAG: hypothetical protein PVJ00_09090, partial [Desulfobacterales bacterium]